MDENNSNTPKETPQETGPDHGPQPVAKRPKRENNLQKSTAVFVGVIVALLFVVIGLGIGMGIQGDYFQGGKEITSRPDVANDGNKVVTSQENDIANIVSKVSPSVVSITTKSQAQTFFGVAQQEGAGTGIIVSSDGYIMTNNHVVKDANTVGVVLSDGTSYDDVKVVGSDPLNDVAFLKIANAKDLKTAELGNSSTVRVGQQVVAIGNSLGQYQNTVTSGIVSGKGRPVSAGDGRTVESLTDLIQTDAAINPGNSGGPLLNMAGQVIGMNTAMAAEAQGIGFAIPINSIKGELKGVLSTGKVARAFLGVSYVPITPDAAKSYKLSVQEGAYVYNGSNEAVAPGSPAAKAGVKDKDIITKVNGVEIGANGALSTLIGEYTPGDTINLTLLRGGKEQVVQVTLGEYK